MKGYLVNIENNEFENYLIYLDDIPSYDKNKNQWFGFGEPIVVDKNNISRNVKLPAKGEMTEVELIDVTARAMLNIGFSDFTINVNDRRILRNMLQTMGFAPETLDSVCITFDKLDKIGASGIEAELREKQFPENAVSSLVSFISSGKQITLDSVVANCSDSSVADDLKYVISTAQAVSGGAYKVEYSPNLVRGQGYYTGMVFEIASSAFSGAVGGGGRYCFYPFSLCPCGIFCRQYVGYHQ